MTSKKIEMLIELKDLLDCYSVETCEGLLCDMKEYELNYDSEYFVLFSRECLEHYLDLRKGA